MRRRAREILTDPPRRRPGQRCRVCSRPEIVQALREWAQARAVGGLTTLWAFHERYLAVVHSDCPSFCSVRGHVLRCCRLDPVTAKPLR